MASYSRRERITKHIEYTIPTYGAGGAPIGEVMKAYAAAAKEAVALGLDPGSDDWGHVDSDDEHIIIRIEVRDRG